MRPAQLILYPSVEYTAKFRSFAFKVTDAEFALVIMGASRDQFEVLLDESEEKPGLYILQAESTVVYVGQSKNLATRLKQHRGADKISFVRGFILTREYGLAGYLDYGEARLYERLTKQGFSLEQSSLHGVVGKRRKLLTNSMEAAHVLMADTFIDRFLEYASALGLITPDDSGDEGSEEPEDGFKMGLDQQSTNNPVDETSKRSVRTTLIVKDSEGNLISPGDPGQQSGADVFIKCLEIAGCDKVESIGIKINGEPLISSNPHCNYVPQSHKCGQWYIATHSSTASKFKILSEVSAALSLDWDIRIVPRR